MDESGALWRTEFRHGESALLTLGPPRRFAIVGDGDPFVIATIGYLELRDGEYPTLPIRAVQCPRHPGVRIASVFCAMNHDLRKDADG